MQDEIEKLINQVKNETDYFNKARLLLFLRKKKDIPLKTLAKRLDTKPQKLCHIMRLTRLPELIVDGYYSKLISLSHLFILSRIKDQEKMIKVYENMLTSDLTTQQTEDLVRESIYEIKSDGKRLTKEEKENLINRISKESKDLKINIVQTRVKSKIIIEIKGGLGKTSEILKKLF